MIYGITYFEDLAIGNGLLIFFIIVAIIGTISAIGTYSSEFKDLLDIGVITQEEFDAKK